MVATLDQHYNVGEKPTVILSTYDNRHAGTPLTYLIMYYIVFVFVLYSLEHKERDDIITEERHIYVLRQVLRGFLPCHVFSTVFISHRVFKIVV